MVFPWSAIQTYQHDTLFIDNGKNVMLSSWIKCMKRRRRNNQLLKVNTLTVCVLQASQGHLLNLLNSEVCEIREKFFIVLRHQCEQAQTFHGVAQWHQMPYFCILKYSLTKTLNEFFIKMKTQHTTAVWFLWLLNRNHGINFLKFTLTVLYFTSVGNKNQYLCQNALIYFYIRKNSPLLIKGLCTLFLFQCKKLGLKKRKHHKNLDCFLKLFEFSGNGHSLELCTSFLLFSFKYVYCMFHMPPCGLQ